MFIPDQVRSAIEYVRRTLDSYELEGRGVTEAMNDACNLYATSYEEYMHIWEHLTDIF